MLRHRDQFALHQPAGRLLGIRQCRFDCGTIVGIQRVQDGSLIGVVHVLDDGDCIVGVELGGDLGNLGGVERINHAFANVIVHFGQHVPIEHVAERRRHRPTSVLWCEFE